MANEESVTIKVGTDADLSDVELLENKIKSLKKEKIDLNIRAKQSEITSVNEKIAQLKREVANLSSSELSVRTNMNEINNLISEIDKLEAKSIDLNLAVEKSQLESAIYDAEELDGKTANVNVNVEGDEQIDSASERVSNLSSKLMGVAGAIGVVDSMTNMWNASTQRQTTQFYLASQLGTQKAREMQSAIQDIVAEVPGDDTFMNTVLSGALAKQTDLTTSELKKGASAMADYMAGSEMQGKNALEAQQDLKSYILSGSTAELERSSILSNQVDLLKDKATVQERVNALAEALDNEKFLGIAGMDTASNKLMEFQGQMEKSTADIGDLFLPLEEGILDLALSMNNEFGGALTGVLAGAQLAIPTLVTGLSAVGDAGLGLKSVRDGVKWFRELDLVSNTLIPTLRNAGTALLTMGRNALTAGANAVRSAAMWLVQKAQVVASTIANWAATASQWALNIAMSMNPIMIVVLAVVALIAVLGYLYFNNEQVRAAIDGLGQTLIAVGQIIWNTVINAINTVSAVLNGFWSYLVGLGTQLWSLITTTLANIVAGLVGFLAWYSTLPARISQALVAIISRVISFGAQMVSNFASAASRAVSNFMSYISSLPSRLQTELNNMLSAVGRWASTLPQKFWDAGVDAVKNFLSALGIASPGTMQRMLVWEVTEMGRRVPVESRRLLSNIEDLGADIVTSFGEPSLGLDYNMGNPNIGDFNNETMGNQQIINLNVEVGTVDSDDRVQEVVDAIRRELAWNNTTAGRRV